MNSIIEKIKTNHSKTALIHKGTTYTYSDIFHKINYYKSLITNTIEEGQTVAIISNYNFFSISLFFSLVLNKNIIVPITTKVKEEISVKLNEGYVNYYIEISDEGDLHIEKNICDKKHILIQTLKDLKQSGLILFSSGTTGVQKSMLHNLDNLINSYKNSNTKELTVILFLDFDHIAGLDTLFRIFSVTGTLVLPENREPYHICSLIEKYKINVLPVSPTFLNFILLSEAYKNYDLTSLKIIGYGSEQMPETLLKKVRQILPHVELQQKFGTSETSALRIVSKTSESLYFKIIDKNTEYKIIENELWLKSKNNILGYLNIENSDNLENNWFKTGDIVKTDEDGFIKIIGRKKEIINVGGNKVYPTEVENIILQMNEIKDCVVYGEKNILTGQAVVADIALKENYQRDGIKSKIIKFCIEHLDRYKVPIKFNIKEEIMLNKRQKKQRI